MHSRQSDHFRSDHLAEITPIAPEYAGRVLGFLPVMLTGLLLIVIHTSWISILFLVMYLLRESPASAPLLTAMLILGGLCFQFLLSRTYPEWPLNHLVRCRLSKNLQRRGIDRRWLDDEGEIHFLEWVPDDRWDGQHLDNASDVMLARREDNCLFMEGDKNSYRIPGASILQVDFQAVTFRGWMTPTFLVVLTVRTKDGPIELPIARRDFRLGSLSASSRRALTMTWCDQIHQIATGNHFGLVIDDEDTSEIEYSPNPYQPSVIS